MTLPNISQGIQAGSIFAFIVSFGQFEVSLFLSAPNSEPLPIAMYNSLRYKFEPDAAARRDLCDYPGDGIGSFD